VVRQPGEVDQTLLSIQGEKAEKIAKEKEIYLQYFKSD